MEIPVREPRRADETEAQYARRRAEEALAFVALAAPECVRMLAEIDVTLVDDRLSCSARELAREHRSTSWTWERHAPADR